MEEQRRAIQDFDRGLALDPTNAMAWYSQGKCKMITADLKGSVADFTKAIELGNNAAYAGRGNARARLNDFNGAIADLNKAIQLNPEDSDSFYYRGLARSKMSKFAEAMVDYNESIRINPPNYMAYYGRGVCKTKLGNAREAVADYNMAIEINGASASTLPYYNDLITENTIKLLDVIIQKYTQPKDLSPGRPEVYLSRGIA
jgi:tetratricopeptide (TPR) repeat protein